MLVLGARASETRAIARSARACQAAVVVVSSREEAALRLAERSWPLVLLDARWELDLAERAAAQARVLRLYVSDAKRASATCLPLPLGQADVRALLDQVATRASRSSTI